MSEENKELLLSKAGVLTCSKSDWNNGQINMPVFITKVTYDYNGWAFVIYNEDRDSPYKQNDYFQGSMSNHWSVKATSNKQVSDYTFEITRNGWLNRKLLGGSPINIKHPNTYLRSVLEKDKKLIETFTSPFVKFMVNGESYDEKFELRTAFNTNKFSDHRIHLALNIMERLVDLLSKR